MVTCIGSDMGKVALSTGEVFTNQQINSLIVESGDEPEYVYYNLLMRKKELRAKASGSAQPILNKSAFGATEIELPSVSAQIAVVDVLKSIDDRIDLLRQTNATLESIAQALFKSWFTDFDPVHAKQAGREPADMNAATAALFPAEFEESALGLIPKGWNCVRLGDVLELVYGKALKATDRREGPIPVYGSGGVTGYHDEPLVHQGSVIVGRKGTVGSLYWEDGSFYAIDTTFYVKPKSVPLTYCYYAMQRLGLDTMNTDAAVPGLNRDNAYRLEVLQPNPSVLIAFNEVAKSLRASILNNNERASTLANLRDALLPRLISGKLRLPEAQAQLEDALA